MTIRPVAVLAYMLLISCAGPAGDREKAGPATSQTDSTAGPSEYFPLEDFLKNEISLVDSTPVGIVRYRAVGAARDSGYIDAEAFHELASSFFSPETSAPNFRRMFEETSFLDQTTGDATFFYSARHDTLPVKRIDIVTAKGDVYDEVKSIYMEKRDVENGSEVVKKLFWKPKRNFQIITQEIKAGSAPDIEMIKVVWDDRE